MLRRAFYIGSLVLCYTPKAQGLADLPDKIGGSAGIEAFKGHSKPYIFFRKLLRHEFSGSYNHAGKGPPASPGISAVVLDDNLVQVQWESADTAALYDIYRSQNHEMPALLHSAKRGEPAMHTDSAVIPGNSYAYYVKATDPVQGLASWSPAARVVVEAKTLAVQFEDIRNDTATHRLYFKWNKPNAKIISYRILVTRKGVTSTLCRVDGETSEVVCRYEGQMRGAVFSIEPIEIR